MAGGPWARADLDLLVWIVAWVAHALRTQPAALFQGNIFHPAPDTLASSEHLLGLAPIAAPVFWASGNAILAYNVTVLVVVWIAALTTFALVRAWTASSAAALLAGAAFGLAPLVTGSWVRLHVSAVQLFPLLLLLAWRTARDGRPRDLVLLAALTWLQILAGAYVSFELAAMMLAFVPALLLTARRGGRSGVAPLVALAAGALAAAPVALPYLRLRATGRLPSLDDALRMIDFGAPSATGVLTALAAEVTWPVLFLALLGLVWSQRVAPHVRLGLALIAALGWILTAATKLPLLPGGEVPSLYELAMRVVPGFAGMRTSIRFLVLPLLAAAVLAGIGAAQLVDVARRLRGAGGARAATAVLAAASAVLVLARPPQPPLPLARVSLAGAEMAAQRWLRDAAEPGAVLELPVASSPLDGGALRVTGLAMLGSTLHWRPLLNGYSGHPPASAQLVATLAQRLPDPDAVAALCSLTGLRFVVAHFGLMPGEEERWRAISYEAPALEQVARFGDDAVFRVRRDCAAPDAATIAALAAAAPERTLGGAPLRALSRDEARREIRGELPATAPPGQYSWLWVDVTNHGTTTWPGLAASVPWALQLRSRWRDAATGAVLTEGEAIPLARDLAPGETIRAQVNVLVPLRAGAYVLEVGLVQQGFGWLEEAPDGVEVLRRTVIVGAPVAATATGES